MVGGIGGTSYAYDQAGLLLSEGGLWPNDTVNYTYQNRLRKQLSLTHPDGSSWTENYEYDDARRLANVASPAGAVDTAIIASSVVTPAAENLDKVNPDGLDTALKSTLGLFPEGQPYNLGNNPPPPASVTTYYTYRCKGKTITTTDPEPPGKGWILIGMQSYGLN